jgi:hypothetical protein
MSSGTYYLWAWFPYLFVVVSLIIYFPTLTVRSMDGVSGPIGLSQLWSLDVFVVNCMTYHIFL